MEDTRESLPCDPEPCVPVVGAESARAQAFAETSDGYLWIGTTGGLTRFDGTRFVLYGSNILPSPDVNSIFCLSPSKDGSLWIGTEGGDMLHLKTTWSKATGRPRDLPMALSEASSRIGTEPCGWAQTTASTWLWATG